MKILKKPKLLPLGCKRCGCLYLPKRRNLVICPETKVKDGVPCPYCKTVNKARFENHKSEDLQEVENG